MEIKEIIVKKTALYAEGTKYLERASEGPINAPVFFQDNGKGKLEAVIDGEAIGLAVGLTMADLPAKYDAKITGLGDKAQTFSIEMKVVEEAATSDDGDTSAYAKEIAEAEKASGLKDVADRVKVMIDNSVKPSVIRATLKSYHPVENPHVPSALYKNTRDANEESILNQALIAAATRSALIFAGEKSTGKNVCAETVAYCRGESFYRINFEKDMRATCSATSH